MTATITPLAFDLYCGLGGWTDGLLAEGYEIIGFDIEQHVYNEHRYPAQLVLQDVRTLHGRQLKDAALIVASPPCTEFSYMAMPWKRGKQTARALRGQDEFPKNYHGSRTIDELTELFRTCFRLKAEASAAAGRDIPLIVENVRGAQPWVGRAQWNFGSFYLWGDVPALMPDPHRRMNWSDRNKHGQDFTRVAGQEAVKVASLDGGRRTDIGNGARFTSRDYGADGRKWDLSRALSGNNAPRLWADRRIQRLADGGWKQEEDFYMASSGSSKRKAASALIARIPFALAQHIATVYRPR